MAGTVAGGTMHRDSPWLRSELLQNSVTVQTGHLLAPEERRGQEALGVSPISNHRRKRLCKPKAGLQHTFFCDLLPV